MTIKCTCLASTLMALVASHASAQRRDSESYQDADLGISFILPGAWTRVPQNPNASWVAARFLADTKPYGRAQARVVVLPQGADRARTLLSPDPTDPYSIRLEGAGCATYGAFVEESTENIHPVGKKFEVKEAGSGKSPLGPYADFAVRDGCEMQFLRRARLFEREGMLVAIEVTVLKEKHDDLEKLWKSVVGSVRTFPAPKRASAPTDRWLSPRLLPEDYPAWRALPTNNRRALRTQSENIWSDAIKRHTTPAWRFVQSKRFSVVSPTAASIDACVVNLETFASYLDLVLGPLSDDRVRRWVLRICTDGEQRDVFNVHSSPAGGFSEVVLPVFEGSPDQLSCGGAHRTMFWTYLHDKNPVLGTVLPRWLEEGLDRGLYYSSRVRGGTVDFDGDDWAKWVRDLEKKGKLTPLRQLTALNAQAFHDLWVKADTYEGRLDVQCQIATSFMLRNDHRLKPLQNFLTRYLQALADACDTISAARDRSEFLEAAHAKINATVFGTDDDVWRQIEAAFRAYVRG